MKIKTWGILIMLALFTTCQSMTTTPTGEKPMKAKISKSEKEWKQTLSEEQYAILRKGATERAFTGKYNDFYETGVFYCGACGSPLFSSETKYDHGTGWPSFTAPFKSENLAYRDDFSLNMKRTEVLCSVCGSHLGHVFKDGPPPTNMHYCINSGALDFKPGKSLQDQYKEQSLQTATFAAGCFWGIEHKFQEVEGVISTQVGYTGGKTENPSYKQVCSGDTGHAEAVEIRFDPLRIRYGQLLQLFFRLHDSTQLNRQGPDIGDQYRSAVFYHSQEQKKAAESAVQELQKSGKFSRPIVTQILPAEKFYRAEEYHQKYYEKLKKR